MFVVSIELLVFILCLWTSLREWRIYRCNLCGLPYFLDFHDVIGWKWRNFVVTNSSLGLCTGISYVLGNIIIRVSTNVSRLHGSWSLRTRRSIQRRNCNAVCRALLYFTVISCVTHSMTTMPSMITLHVYSFLLLQTCHMTERWHFAISVSISHCFTGISEYSVAHARNFDWWLSVYANSVLGSDVWTFVLLVLGRFRIFSTIQFNVAISSLDVVFRCQHCVLAQCVRANNCNWRSTCPVLLLPCFWTKLCIHWASFTSKQPMCSKFHSLYLPAPIIDDIKASYHLSVLVSRSVIPGWFFSSFVVGW